VLTFVSYALEAVALNLLNFTLSLQLLIFGQYLFFSFTQKKTFFFIVKIMRLYCVANT